MPTEIITGYSYYPTGMALDDVDAYTFAIQVTYRGTYPHRRNGGPPVSWYSVENRTRSLSRAGNWAFQIQRFQYQQYRFTLAEAREWAMKMVDSVEVMGLTWAQWGKSHEIKSMEEARAHG
jgi:hypothetical protein